MAVNFDSLFTQWGVVLGKISEGDSVRQRIFDNLRNLRALNDKQNTISSLGESPLAKDIVYRYLINAQSDSSHYFISQMENRSMTRDLYFSLEKQALENSV